MTPSIFTGERFGLGHTPIATPTNPATGQPLSPYASQTGTDATTGGFGHPAGVVPPNDAARAANAAAVGAGRAAFSGMSSVTQPIAQPGATTAPAGGQTFRNQFGTYTVPQGDPYYAQGTQPSTNPATFTTNQYESGLNENWAAQMVNMYNANNPGQAPTTFNEADWNQYWNSLTKGGTGFNPSAAPPTGMFGGPGAQSMNYQMGGGGPAPAYGMAPANYSPYAPQNAFSPQGAGSTLPNMFGQGTTGVNSGTNIAGGGGNMFGGPGMQTQGGAYTTGGRGQDLPRYSTFGTGAGGPASGSYGSGNLGAALESAALGWNQPFSGAQPAGGQGQTFVNQNGQTVNAQGMPAGGWQTAPSQQWQQQMAAWLAANPSPPGGWQNLMAAQQGGAQQGGGGYGTPDQALASLAGNLGYLQNIAQGGGNPINASPAWQSAVAAMQQQIGTGAADLAARFAGSGNLDSSAYGTAMQQYYNQAQLQENQLTAQYGYQSATDAQNRLLQAAGQLGQGATGALGQLSSQAYGANQATQAQQAQMALAMLGAGSTAAQQLSAQSYGAAGQLNQAAIQGVMANLQNQQYLQSLGLSGANQLSQDWLQNLLGGASMGQQQYTDAQSAINNAYQEWLRGQPQNNPLLQMLFSAATSYPGLTTPIYGAPQLGQLLGGLGSIFGGLGTANIGKILQSLGIGGGGSNTNIGITPPGVDPTGGSTGDAGTGGF